jgi:Flp pilus assembly protein TadD
MRNLLNRIDVAMRPASTAFFRARSRALAGAGVLALGLVLGGCASGPLASFRSSLGDVLPPAQQNLDTLAKQYDARPGERNVSLAYAEALRAQGQHGQAVAVLQAASIKNVGDRQIAAAYGKALSDVGRFQEASAVLSQAHTEDRPDWRVLSAQGVVADQMGDHVRARQFYSNALDIHPNHPKILTNLALSYVLTQDLAKAQEILQFASTQPEADERVLANLELVTKLKANQPGGARPTVNPPKQGINTTSKNTRISANAAPPLPLSHGLAPPVGKQRNAENPMPAAEAATIKGRML